MVAPTDAIARSALRLVARRAPGYRLTPYSLQGFLSDVAAPRRIVLLPAGVRVAQDVDFVRSVQRRVLWPPPPPELSAAIAGLRGEDDSAPAAPDSRSRAPLSALLLEGAVTPVLARRAAASRAPRDWIVERVQSVRLGTKRLEALSRRGIRWSVLEPVEVAALAASASLADSRRRWAKFLAANVPVWVITPRPVRGPRREVQSRIRRNSPAPRARTSK